MIQAYLLKPSGEKILIDMETKVMSTFLECEHDLRGVITFDSTSKYIDPNNATDMKDVESIRIGFCDIETTGLSEVINPITQFSGYVTELNNTIKKNIAIDFDIFINPETHIPNRIHRITGISDDTMRRHTGMTFDKFIEIITFFNHSEVIMTWNGLNFDKPRVINLVEKYLQDYKEDIQRFCEYFCIDHKTFFQPASLFENEWLDLFKIISGNPIYSSIVAGAKNNKQTTISAFLGLPDYEAHNSLEDVKALSRIYYHLADNDVIPSCYGKFLLAQSGVAI